MIQSHFDSAAQEAIIVLRPNHSWTWRANVYLLVSLMFVSLTVGLVLLTMGYWIILVFTTLELLLVGACLYYCVNKTHIQEVIRISQEQLVRERGTRKPTVQIRVHRFFARFLVQPRSRCAGEVDVVLRAQEVEQDVGSFLTHDEKNQLVSLLRHTIGRFNN